MEKKLNYELCFNNTKLKWTNPDFSGLIDEQIKRINAKKPSVIVIDGVHSGGKTTFGSHIGQYISAKYGQDFDYENQVGKGMDKFLEKLKFVRTNGKKVCIYDEADDFDRKGALSRFNRMLNRVFSVMRINKIVVIIILGCVKQLEKIPLQKGLIRCLINVHGRKEEGDTANIRIYDAGNIFYLMWLMEKFERSGKAPISAYSNTYPIMRSRILRADSNDEKLWDYLDHKDKDEIQDDAALETKGLINIKKVAKESGYSISYLRILLRKIKPEVQKIGNKNYYYRSILKRIEEASKPIK